MVVLCSANFRIRSVCRWDCDGSASPGGQGGGGTRHLGWCSGSNVLPRVLEEDRWWWFSILIYKIKNVEMCLKVSGCCVSNSLKLFRVVAGGEEQSRLVGGDVTSVDLDQLDPGAQYEVQVMALVQNREGNPVSVRITTRESHLSYRCRLNIQKNISWQ